MLLLLATVPKNFGEKQQKRGDVACGKKFFASTKKKNIIFYVNNSIFFKMTFMIDLTSLGLVLLVPIIAIVAKKKIKVKISENGL